MGDDALKSWKIVDIFLRCKKVWFFKHRAMNFSNNKVQLDTSEFFTIWKIKTGHVLLDVSGIISFRPIKINIDAINSNTKTLTP